MKKVRNRMETAAVLYHQMREESSRFIHEEIRSSKRYLGARALLNMRALTDESLKNQVAFWNDLPEIESSDHHTDDQEKPAEENSGDTVEDPAEDEIDEDL